MPKRILKGSIVKKNDRTLVVSVKRVFSHPLYVKIIKRSKKYYVDCPAHENYSLGQLVSIVESKPLSKTKRWILL